MNTMKIRSMSYSLAVAVAAIALCSNCTGNKKEDHTAHGADTAKTTGTKTPDEAKTQFEVDKNFQRQLADVFTSYINLKDAFVAADAAKVKDEAKRTSEMVSKVDMALLSGAAHNDWMTFLTPIQNSLNKIQNEADIESQRKEFSTLSDNLYKSVKAFGLGGKEAFYEYCPMAFDNKGAYWLSDQEKIRNPYFGDQMLTCGSVKEKLN